MQLGKFFGSLFGGGKKKVPVVAVSSLPGYRHVVDNGEKFPGGLGPIDILFKDLWALRARSAELFERNMYCRGIVRRFVTNVINTGLHLEAIPEERLLGYPEDGLGDWAEEVENRFKIWEKNPYQCDFDERRSFGQLQADAWREALVAGDVLVVVRQDPRTRCPRVQLISGARVQTPWAQRLSDGTRIEHGVEIDARGRHVAFWITQEDGSFKRLPAYGEKSGRKLAWLVYGTDRRLDDVRGTPLVGLILQALKEVDRYRDATLRKAVINSMLAMYIEKSEERFGSLPMTGGATKIGTEVATDNTGGAPKRYRTADMIPGLVIDELQHGEKPVPFQVNNTVENFGDFEEAIICACAWALEVPPEILRLTFSSNYSASQAAISEFKLFLNPTRTRFGEEFCAPIYEEWLLSQVFVNRISAPGLWEAFKATNQDDIYGAWIANDWSGHVKPSIDPVKTTKAYVEQAANGLIDLDRAAREVNGTSFDKNVKKLKRQYAKLAEARRPMAELEASTKAPPPDPGREPSEPDDENDDKGGAERAA
jgi:capsid protein